MPILGLFLSKSRMSIAEEVCHLRSNNELYEYMLPNMDSTFRLFAAHLRSVDASWTYPKHTDTMFELNLVTEGHQAMIVNGREQVQNFGDILLLKPGDIHQGRCYTGPSMTYHCLHFDVDDRPLRELLYSNRRILYTRDSLLAREINSTMHKLIRITVCPNEYSIGQRMLALSVVFELFLKLSEVLSVENGLEKKSAETVISRAIAEALEHYAEENSSEGGGYPRDVVRQIPINLGYSISTCGRIFHDVYGMSPRQYLSSIKLRKAKLLLIESRMSVEAISRKLGYGDIAHFSRQFKRWTGQSPRQFRKTYQ